MCGRFTLKTQPDQWGQLLLPLLDMEFVQRHWMPRYNIAPTQDILTYGVNCETAERLTAYMRWGLVPSWADDLAIGSRMINARADTITEKRSYIGPLKKRRCIIVADGYYEWETIGKKKQPHWIHPVAGGAVAMAGLWETNSKATGEPIQTCTIITTSANETLGKVHDRMPAMLFGPALQQWLDPHLTVEQAHKLLAPSDDRLFTSVAVDTHVNNARNDDANCLKVSQTLFD